MNATVQLNPRLDLLLERVVDVPPDLVWAAWTVPEHVKKWFTPAPWRTIDCEIDLRSGGIFRIVMRGPEGSKLSISAASSRLHRAASSFGQSRSARVTGGPIRASTFRRSLQSSAWSRTGRERNTALSPCTSTEEAATSTSGWGSAKGGAERSTNSSPTPRRCRRRAGRHREQSVKKFSPTLRSISRGKWRINLIFSVLFKLILDPGG